HDDFFALGGHSLLATQIVGRVREMFALELPLAVIFEAPTVAKMARLVDDAVRAAETEAPVRREVVTRCAGDGPEFPASYMQEQMWLAVQADPSLPVYNVPVAVLVRADADVDALERAFTDVVRRHEGLRTVFRFVDGELRQVVQPPYPVRVDVRDLRDRVRDDFATAVRRIVAEEGGRPMDLERGPLARIALLRVSDDRAALVITLHHIVTDGWAYPLILSELWELYAAYRHGRTVALQEPELRYADYAVWQRRHLTGETLEWHLAYWRALLDDAPYTELPGDRPRPPVSSYRGAFHHFTVPTETESALRALCRREGATLNMVLSAAFAAVLARYGGSGDVVFGELFGNRNRPELEGVVGCFVNSAALRLDLRDDPSFAGAVRRARAQVLAADAHQELPFELVVEHLRAERSPSRNPVFGAMYFHHTYIPAHSQATGEAELDPRPIYGSEASLVDTGVAKLDLILATLEGDGKLTGSVEYSTDLYDASTIERFCRHLLTLAARAAADPDLPLSRVSLLDDAERAQLRAWSEGAGEFTPAAGVPVHRRFEALAAASPRADAVRYAGDGLTYAELDRRANAVARRLRALGVRPEARVGVCMESGPALLAAVLGIWKAGGAFVPLDPVNPAERLGWIVSDARLEVIVTAGAAADTLPPHNAVLVRADDLDDADEERPAWPEVSADHLAYVIYTSGSTGRPKGVLVRHGSLSGLLETARETFDIGPGDVMPATASYAFDIWLVEALLPLVTGAVTRIVERARVLDVPRLLRELSDSTHLHAVPALMREIAEAELSAPRLRALRRVFVGGDSVPAALLAEMRDAFPDASVAVLYGPTEGTILASSYAVPRQETVVGHPIGRPLHGRLYVCGERGEMQPTGVPGELLIGGNGVARGYLGSAALTAEKFVPVPFGGAPGARLYRTGDRARWRADGVLEFLGRLDRQVKIRGFRIELGEVEAALAAVSGVREAAVSVREDAPGARRLVAYATTAEGVTAETLRDALRRRLPDYMVPAAYVLLDELPRTTTGKLDRRALPAPDTSAAGAAAYLAPRDEMEAALARAWAKVLGRDRVGVRDNFFELGGDSILAVRMIAHAAEEGVRVLPWQVFRYQEIAALADAVRAEPDAPAADAAETVFSTDGLDEIDDDVLSAVLGELGLD
ncbi:MAG TPA: amino acid adenylation domain-containing protein, partial [Longimicrobium sp.]|nr:amino acid adenylation domain-containing protein [Longimicrobium sp.]